MPPTRRPFGEGTALVHRRERTEALETTGGQVAAECAIDHCGVQAVGRCSACGRAMCMSHQSQDYVNECSECYSARYKAQSDSFHDAIKQGQRVEQRFQAIVRRVVDAGIPSEHCFQTQSTHFKDRWFGGQKEVRRREDVYGWFVGVHTWVRPQATGRDGTGDIEISEQSRTYVTPDGRITRENNTWGSRFSGDLEEIIRKMLAIARNRGIEIP